MTRAGPDAALDPALAARLLGRPALVCDRDRLRRAVAGHRVLVTGAGGSIGGELARLLAGLGVRSLTLIDLSEEGLFWSGEALREQAPDVPVRPIIGSVTNRALLDETLGLAEPELVFHAAACKHVALVEDNPLAGIEHNVLGTDTLLAACRAAGVDRCLLVSTDKAHAPVSVMGATKRVAERLVAAAAPPAGAWAAVRFGNVLGSSGSVLQIFRRRLAAGLPLEIRDRQATRHFLTLAEAGELLVLASELAAPGDLLALAVGDPLPIETLARRLLEAETPSGPGRPASALVYTRLGSGERRHEASGGAPARPTAVTGIGRLAVGEADAAGLAAGMASLRRACAVRDRTAALAALWALAR